MFLLRLSPVFPFVFLNYALGLTRVRLLDYALACFGMLPGTLLYVYYGKVVGDVAALAAGAAAERGAAHYVVLGLGLVATLVVTTVVTRIAQRALREQRGARAARRAERPDASRRPVPLAMSERAHHDVTVEPFDQHNQRLVENVHPPGWRNPTPKDRYHLVVIGAGAAGLVSAVGSAGLGAKVALVERHLLGGDCLNVGCVPSKAVIRAARAWHDARAGAAFGAPRADRERRRLRGRDGAHAPRARADQPDRQRGAVDQRRRGRLPRARALHRPRLGRRWTAAKLRFRRAVIATGARAAAPPIPGLEQAGYRTNETVFALTELPPRLAVIGAGPIGCELAQAFARFGSRVTLFDVAPQILIREDADAAEDRRRRAGARRRRARARREHGRGAWRRRRLERADHRLGARRRAARDGRATRSWSRWAGRPTSRISDWRRPASPTTGPESWSTNGCAPPTPGSSPPATSRRCSSSRTSPTRTPRW